MKIAEKQEQGNKELSRISGKIKMMLLYIYEHYPEKITVQQVAEAAFISERECFRVFRDCLQTPPGESLMEEGCETVTAIGQACGLGSSSYFGRIFRETMGMTPVEYRKQWRDSDIKRR